MKKSFDVIVIGSGQSGPFLRGADRGCGPTGRHYRAASGERVSNTGCIPTKALVASAYASYMARRAAEFGIQVAGPVCADMKRVKARKDEFAGKSRSGVESLLRSTRNCTSLRLLRLHLRSFLSYRLLHDHFT